MHNFIYFQISTELSTQVDALKNSLGKTISSCEERINEITDVYEKSNKSLVTQLQLAEENTKINLEKKVQLETEIITLKETVHSLEENAKISDTERIQLKNDLLKLFDELHSTNDALAVQSASKTERDELVKELQQQIIEERVTLNKNISILQLKDEKNKTKIHDLIRALHDKDTLLTDAKMSNNECKKLFEKDEQELSAQINVLNATVHAQNNELESLGIMKKNYHEQMELSNSQQLSLDECRTEINNILKEKTDLEKKLNEFMLSLADVTQDLVLAKSDNHKLAAEQIVLSKKLEKLEDIETKLQINLTEKLSQSKMNAQLLEENAVLTQTNTSLIESQKLSDEKLQQVLELVKSNQLTIAEAQTQFKKNKEEIESISHQNEDLKVQNSILPSSYSDLLEKQTQTIAALKSNKDELTVLHKENINLKQICQERADNLVTIYDCFSDIGYEVGSNSTDTTTTDNLVEAVIKEISQHKLKIGDVEQYKLKIRELQNQLHDLQLDQEDRKKLKENLGLSETFCVKKEKSCEIDSGQTVLDSPLCAMYEEKIADLNAAIYKYDEKYAILKEEMQQISMQEKENKTAVAILKAKLMKNRETTAIQEKEWLTEKQVLIRERNAAENRVTETRIELEGKLEKMKDKMVSSFLFI